MCKRQNATKLLIGALCLFILPRLANASDFGIYQKGKGIILKTAGQEFRVEAGGKGSGWLNIENVTVKKNTLGQTVNTNLTDKSYKQWTHFNVGKIEEIKIVKDEADEKIAFLKIRCSDWYKEKENYDVYYMEANLKIKRGIPCLFIYQRIKNPTKIPQKLDYGSYTSGISFYSGDNLEISTVDPEKKKWHEIAKGDWIWVKRKITEQTEGKKGFGIISFTPTHFCLLFTHRIFWGYSVKVVSAGCFREYKMAVMAAESPEDVKAVYEKIRLFRF